MAHQVPELFDPVKARRGDERARRHGFESFLIDRMTEDLVERLSPVLRSFARPLDFATPDFRFSQGLARSGKVAGDIARLAEEGTLDPSALPDAGESGFDLIASGMSLHRINDLPGLLARFRRALRPDGMLIAAFPGGDTLAELRDALMQAESEVRGAAGLRVFPMIDVRAAGQLLQRAGFALPVVDSERLTVRYDSPFGLIRDLRAMGATALALNRAGQPPLTRAIIARTAELYAEKFADPDGRIRTTFEIIWISGWAPHASQQQPLKPGSAKMRLADALKPSET
ncbi:MAG TPA: methyltransferase domain-containing protein [Rhabdaerophilum sp.]|nr:methyltransferase domain-containing protein [Rhabdaerophilum sp.]